MHPPRLLHLYVSSGHNFFGRHGLASGAHPTEERATVFCKAGQGVEGDRFFGHQPDYKGQITFFAAEVYDDLCATLGVHDRGPEVFRRNVVTRGLDLGALIGVEFALQGVRFLGVGECKPCYWMDGAFGPGAEAQLLGRGGLRAKILSDGALLPGPARLDVLAAASG